MEKYPTLAIGQFDRTMGIRGMLDATDAALHEFCRCTSLGPGYFGGAEE